MTAHPEITTGKPDPAGREEARDVPAEVERLVLKRTEELHKENEDLIRRNLELESANREAILYLNILSHDVRNANNVSAVYAEMLIEDLDGAEKEYALKLKAGIDRSNEIVRDIDTLRQFNQETGPLGPVDLDAIIRKEIRSVPASSIRYEGPQIDVLADSLLPLVFTHLIGNAAKFGGPGVMITIRVEERNGEVLVTVADTGPGIPDDQRERLFNRFERGSSRGSGQGLGLFIVRTLVERYGGKVWVEGLGPGRPEEGAAFLFTLKKAL